MIAFSWAPWDSHKIHFSDIFGAHAWCTLKWGVWKEKPFVKNWKPHRFTDWKGTESNDNLYLYHSVLCSLVLIWFDNRSTPPPSCFAPLPSLSSLIRSPHMIPIHSFASSSNPVSSKAWFKIFNQLTIAIWLINPLLESFFFPRPNQFKSIWFDDLRYSFIGTEGMGNDLHKRMQGLVLWQRIKWMT